MEEEIDSVLYEMGLWDAIAGHKPQQDDNEDYMMGYREACGSLN